MSSPVEQNNTSSSSGPSSQQQQQQQQQQAAVTSFTPNGVGMPAMPGGWALPYGGVNAMQAQVALQAFYNSQMLAAQAAQAASNGGPQATAQQQEALKNNAAMAQQVAQNPFTGYPMMPPQLQGHLSAPDQALVPSISPNVSPDVPRAHGQGSPAAQVKMDGANSTTTSTATNEDGAQAAIAVAQAQAKALAASQYRTVSTSVPVGAQRYRPSNVVPQVSPGMPRARANKPTKTLSLDTTPNTAAADLLRSLSAKSPSAASSGNISSPSSSPGGERQHGSFMAIADAATRARGDTMDTSGSNVTALTARMTLDESAAQDSDADGAKSLSEFDTTGLSRRQLARINNNIASRKSRAKKKAMFEALQAHSDEVEAKYRELSAYNTEVVRERDVLRETAAALEAEVRLLRSQLAGGQQQQQQQQQYSSNPSQSTMDESN